MSEELEQEIESLRRMSRQQLRDRWRALFKAEPPAAFTPDLVARAIAWRVQETALGGLSADTKRFLGASGEHRSPKARPAVRPGNRLIRRWRGRTYVVEAVEGGFTFDGVRFGSLSEVANQITGTRWSGPRFFGLVR